ncbi:MAG: DNA-directed RNA polymerase subunit omega, partial [Oscillospiraceae bacterium]
MLRPAMSQIIREGESHYAFVVAVAQRARRIAEEAEEKGVALDVKPVNLAVEEFAQNKSRVAALVKVK